MIGAFGIGWAAWAAAIAALAGVGVFLAQRLVAQWGGEGDLPRALLVTAGALILTDVAIVHGQRWAWWLSGFGVCAALHRWIDVFVIASPTAPMPTPVSSSAPSRPRTRAPSRPSKA